MCRSVEPLIRLDYRCSREACLVESQLKDRLGKFARAYSVTLSVKDDLFLLSSYPPHSGCASLLVFSALSRPKHFQDPA